jgi:hypothetical protein
LSSLKKKLFDIKKKGKSQGSKNQESKVKQTHESSNSNISGSGSLAASASPDVSFLTEVLEEAMSPACFLFSLQIFVFRVSRGRRHSRFALFSRFFGIISVLALVSLGGFRTSRSRISLDWPFLGKMRTRNQNLMVLQHW